MQDSTSLNSFNYILSTITILTFSSLILSEIADILMGNKGFFFFPSDRNRVKILRAAIADNSLSQKAKVAATQELETIAYRYTTGIKADKVILEEIYHLVQSSNRNINYHDFKNALSYLKISNRGNLELRKINLFDFLVFLYWMLMVLITLPLIPYLFISLIASETSLSTSLYLSLIIAIETLIIFMSSWRISKFLAVLKISKELRSKTT